ncbi:hypothetical protein HQ602_11965 [Rhodococcus kroppenstedtii]|uniref:hypothetical protein n=1 Tax=Rhodococcoides kroppenstedtii TaxID=293050 RepID=UPI001C9B51AB|nr:hypothetical protein [Rhodococcus kroppenstedtii]MBY6437099.1 hypothetical protein [Rhodococcus kroppenstedtii]
MTARRSDGCRASTACATVPLAAASASLLSIPWHDPGPRDLLTLAAALGLVRRTTEDSSPLSTTILTAREAADCAAASWYDELGFTVDDARREAHAVAAEIREVVAVSDCTCDSALSESAVVAAAVAGAVADLAGYVASQSGPPVPWEVFTSPRVLDRLRRVASALVLVAEGLDEA